MDVLKLLSSARITVVCLFLLFVLTFWGTVAQVQQGLYAAQERFFTSFFFLAAGWLPFPGAQLVLWVLFINLVCALISHFHKQHDWTYIGSKITHCGLLLYFVAAFFIFHLSQESYVRLAQGQATDISVSYTDWGLAYWQEGDSRNTRAVDARDLKPGATIVIHDPALSINVKQYYSNSDLVNRHLVPKPMDKERERDIAGGIFDLTFDGRSRSLLLFGAGLGATPLAIGGKEYYFILRHKTFPLPFTLTLESFKAQFHPGTDVAKSFESWVTISTGGLKRQVRIYMNNPLRYKAYTLYQASYDTDSEGRQYSTLAVVKNSARLLPYAACLTVFLGLALHFLIQAFVAKSRL